MNRTTRDPEESMTQQRTFRFLVAAILAAAAVLAGCRSDQKEDPAQAWQEKAAQVASQETPATAPGGAMPQAGNAITGEVLETMNSGGYTYVKLKTDTGEVWAAGPETDGVKVGDRVALQQPMLMHDFQAKSLNRTFDQIYFASALGKAGQQSPADAAAEAVTQAHANLVVHDAGMDFFGLTVPDGGLKIADIHARKAKLAGQTVLFRGKVVKYTPGVMGKNWMHVQDGSAGGAAGDITVTTDATAKIGDTVLVQGTLAMDRDFGAGYRYDVIVENARVTVE